LNYLPFKKKNMKRLIVLLAIVFFTTTAFSQGKPVKKVTTKAPAKNGNCKAG